MKLMKTGKKGGDRGRETNEKAVRLPKAERTRISVWKEAIERQKLH
jgi:hypothetical protein